MRIVDLNSAQVIAIEEKGFVVEYNRGPTTTFATSINPNRINIKVKSVQMFFKQFKPIECR